MSIFKKIYTIKITDEQDLIPKNIWYYSKSGKIYEASLHIHQNGGGPAVVFKVSTSPFYHVYPQHCTIINEKVIKIPGR